MKKVVHKFTVEEWMDWLERQRQGFYGGCRVDPYSDQVNEFVQGCRYYLEKDFDLRKKEWVAR